MTAAPLRILRIDIEGFGSLRGSFVLDPARANLVVAPNEDGKTTLAHAIVAVLYDVERDRRRKGAPLSADRFRPWAGAAYAASLEIERGGARFSIRREFESGSARVLDASGRDRTAEYAVKDGDRIGEELIGLSRDVFLRTVFVTHEELFAPRDASLDARLQQTASARDGATAAEARAALQQALDHYAAATQGKQRQVGNEIRDLELRLRACEEDLARIEARRDLLRGDFAEREHLSGEARALDEDGAREMHLARRSDLADIELAVAQEASRLADRDRLVRRREALKDAAAFPASQATVLVSQRTGIETLRDTLRTKTATLRALESQAAASRSRLAEFGSVAAATPDDRARVMACRESLAQAGETSREAILRHAGEKSRLTQRGLDAAEVDLLRRRFEPLADSEREILASDAAFRAGAEARETQAGASEARAGHETEIVLRERSHRRRIGLLLLALSLPAIAGAVFAPPPGRWALAAAGAALALSGIVAALTASARGSDRLAAARADREAARAEMEAVNARRTERDRALSALAKRLGYEDAGPLLADHGRWTSNQAEIGDYRLSDDRLREIEEAQRRARAEASSLAAHWGVAAVGETISARDLDDLAERMRHAAETKREVEQFAADMARLGADFSEDERRLARSFEALVETLRGAGIRIASSETVDAAIAEFEEQRRRHEEFRRLEEVAIPQAGHGLRGDAWLVEQRERASRLRAEIEAVRRPDWDAQAPGPAEAHRARAEERRREASSRKEAARVIEERLSNFAATDQTRVGPLQAQKADVARLLARARDFRDAVQIAMDAIEEVSRETLGSLSRTLNAVADELLEGMHPGLESLRFLDDLEFRVRLPGGRELSREEAQAHLSAGARDQLALVVRVALSEYLSRGETLLPLIFDDPFARSDDARFAAAFRFLVERCAGRHQLLLLSCHESRHRALEDADPGWFAERVRRVPFGER